MTRISEENIYNVIYQSETNQSRKAPVCMLLDSKIKLLRKKDPPFNGNKLGQLFPKQKLFRNSKGKSCIIVSSAGSLSGSNLGSFISKFTSVVPTRLTPFSRLDLDSHDIVMRFNHAPTDGYEADVGNKTTIRIVNSQARIFVCLVFWKHKKVR